MKKYLFILITLLFGFILIPQKSTARLQITEAQQKDAKAEESKELNLEGLEKVELPEGVDIQSIPGGITNLPQVYTKEALEALEKQSKKGAWEYIKSVLPDIAIGLGVVIIVEGVIWIIRIFRKSKKEGVKYKNSKKV